MSDFEQLYHVTLLSNFARAFDKYSRSYSKALIPQSRYPDRFFLLRGDELEIGLRKARELLHKTGLPGDDLIVLQTTVSSAELLPNTRTGMGRYVPRNRIRIDGVFRLASTPREPSGDWGAVGAAAAAAGVVAASGAARLAAPTCLESWRIEEAVAQGLRVVSPAMLEFDRLSPRSVSLLPIALGCQAACRFCYSKSSVSAEQENGRLDPHRVREVLAASRDRGAERAVITGGGEPGLVRFDRLLALVAERARMFPKVVIITNGYFLQTLSDAERSEALAALAGAGLTVLSVSRHHHEVDCNAQIMQLATRSELIATTWLAGRARWPRLRLRYVCVLQRGGVDSESALLEYLTWAAGCGVSEVCFKELYVSTSHESVYHSYEANQWSYEHQTPLQLVLDFAAAQGFHEIQRLPWGAPIFHGTRGGRPMQIAAYTEPSLFWERSHGVARSWNLMADGRLLASLEDRASEIKASALLAPLP